MRWISGARSATAGALATSSCTVFSPMRRAPASTAARTTSSERVLVARRTRTSRGSRSAARAAASTLARSSASLPGSAASVGVVPGDAGLTTGFYRARP